jgi:hypothetical protein
MACGRPHDKAALRSRPDYNDKASAYRGELIGKEHYTREFLDQRNKVPAYDYENIAAVLDLIVKNTIAMREAYHGV